MGTDRAGSLTAEVGWVVGIRPYAAGSLTFYRMVGNPLPGREERAVLRDLRRGQAAHAARTGVDDEAAYLRDEPMALLRALRAREG